MEVKNSIREIEFEAVADVTLANGKTQKRTVKDNIYDTDNINIKLELFDEDIREKLLSFGISLEEIKEELEKFPLSDFTSLRQMSALNETQVEKDMPFITSDKVSTEMRKVRRGRYSYMETFYDYWKLVPCDTFCCDVVKGILSKYMNIENLSIYTCSDISAYLETSVSRVFKDGRSDKINIAIPLKEAFEGNTKQAVEIMLNDLKRNITDTFYKYKTEPYESICMSEFKATDTEVIDNILLNSKYIFAKQLNAIMYGKIVKQYQEYLTHN